MAIFVIKSRKNHRYFLWTHKKLQISYHDHEKKSQILTNSRGQKKKTKKNKTSEFGQTVAKKKSNLIKWSCAKNQEYRNSVVKKQNKLEQTIVKNIEFRPNLWNK